MNDLELDGILRSDKMTRLKYMGTFMLDELPRRVPPSKMLIINESASFEGPGTHWVCLHRPTAWLVEFFDPLSRDVKKPIIDLIHESAPIVSYLDKPIQSIGTTTCGPHCLWVSILWSRGFKLHEIVDLTYNVAGGEKEYLKNDFAIRRLVEDLFELKPASIFL